MLPYHPSRVQLSYSLHSFDEIFFLPSHSMDQAEQSYKNREYSSGMKKFEGMKCTGGVERGKQKEMKKRVEKSITAKGDYWNLVALSAFISCRLGTGIGDSVVQARSNLSPPFFPPMYPHRHGLCSTVHPVQHMNPFLTFPSSPKKKQLKENLFSQS